MKRFFIFSFVFAVIFFSCRATPFLFDPGLAMAVSVLRAASQGSSEIDSSTAFTEVYQDNIQKLNYQTLKNAFREELEWGWIGSVVRFYQYSSGDLQGDSKMEILVGPARPRYWGMGKSTILLLNIQSYKLTEFTMVDYPLYIQIDELI